ncbi:CLUMA_CG016470, isoform A [Clunio marinus]|uniref:CLUMA_CG016470, isoform A n=1 Tax=Clunio marinus TaxID=568069 RepID=A0A1J1IT90_9DIPT|nr:CLUMA_CG016470, isoform A [Clunio marinus]
MKTSFMDNNSEQNVFISIYLYQNGKVCKPEKLRIRRIDISKYFNVKGRCYYNGLHVLHTLDGKPVTCLENLEDNTAFVLVISNEHFICAKYKENFIQMMNKKNNLMKVHTQKRSKSSPLIGCKNSSNISCGNSSQQSVVKKISEEVCVKPKCRSPEHVHCVTKDGFPCCDHDSESESDEFGQSEEECYPKPSMKASASKRPKSRPSCDPCGEGKDKATSASKRTQTTDSDFKKAKKTMKKAIKEEKARQKRYGGNKRFGGNQCARDKDTDDDCLNKTDADIREKKKREDEYKKARQRYHLQRKNLISKINKSLEKEGLNRKF